MKYIRRSQDRGQVDLGWLKSKHSFSFGHYHDPKHMGISALRVINDDMVMPSQGFGTHGHRDMEIISYVIEGALKHEDNTGNKYVVPAGDVQRMSAGTGVMHSEFNASSTSPVKFLQIWIQPNVSGVAPSYEQKSIKQQGQLTPLITPNGSEHTLSINQNAKLSRLMLKDGEKFTLNSEQSVGYLHLVKGSLLVDDLVESEQEFVAGDAFALDPEQGHQITATSALEALWFNLPS
ncbi:pirin family protein [Psychrosphaera sp. F3M07]|uniref:pirin family protein n=1 Tax=Psychrosphaera sp. F3M07 TaxID=2841560 RepID=UPI001C098A6D|nr:pirin-like bicupin family protein [Psychrosphaera sp. F3M07]MBU2918106.1 pirin family protein [Psychrosphaera sp. F3M07]